MSMMESVNWTTTRERLNSDFPDLVENVRPVLFIESTGLKDDCTNAG